MAREFCKLYTLLVVEFSRLTRVYIAASAETRMQVAVLHSLPGEVDTCMINVSEQMFEMCVSCAYALQHLPFRVA